MESKLVSLPIDDDELPVEQPQFFTSLSEDQAPAAAPAAAAPAAAAAAPAAPTAEQLRLAREGLQRIDAAYYPGIRLDSDDVRDYMIGEFPHKARQIRRTIERDEEEFLDGNSFIELDCVIFGRAIYGLYRGYVFPLEDTYALRENLEHFEENADRDSPADHFSEAENGSLESLWNAVDNVKEVQDRLLRDSSSRQLRDFKNHTDFFNAFIRPERVDAAIKERQKDESDERNNAIEEEEEEEEVNDEEDEDD